MLHKKGYIFTNKEHTEKGIMSTILGILSAAAIFWVVYLTYQNRGQAELRYGATMLLSVIFSLAGLVTGIMARMEPDRFYFFSYVGILLNILVLSGTGFILFAGVYGL